MTPAEIAAAARALQSDFEERLALYADALAVSLAEDLQLVAWDREQLIGRLQRAIAALRRVRIDREVDPSPAIVVERRRQPLESLDLAWSLLRRGRAVHLCTEAGTSRGLFDLARGLAAALPTGACTIDPTPLTTLPAAIAGVDVPQSRIAVIDREADRELAAYVLARASLRRSGLDPRAVRHAYVCGPVDRLQRHLGRLWVGAQLGPATDPESFAGPVTAADRDEYLAAHAAWRDHEGVDAWCQGGELERTGVPGIFVAPAAFAVHDVAPALAVAGPMLVVIRCDEATAERALADAHATDRGVIQIGGRAPRRGDVRHVRGALLVERLPPGLPEPRPV